MNFAKQEKEVKWLNLDSLKIVDLICIKEI